MTTTEDDYTPHTIDTGFGHWLDDDGDAGNCGRCGLPVVWDASEERYQTVPNVHSAALDAIRATLWPEEDPDRPWTPDDMETIAGVLIAAGMGRP